MALREGGPAYAIEFCSERALPITAAVQDSLAGGLEVKRTSTRIRQPANAPDSLEQEALAYFHSELEAGRPLPPYHLQQTEGGWRYYRSEEHTSELQSRENLVCRLLLEKKK